MSKRSTIVHFRSKGQEELPPDPERIARLEREKEETKRRESSSGARRKPQTNAEPTSASNTIRFSTTSASSRPADEKELQEIEREVKETARRQQEAARRRKNRAANN
jgi:hypothetical protein